MGYKDQLVTSNKFFRTTSYKLTSLEVRERALYILGDLASTEPPNDMTAWYCDAFKKLGESRFTAIVKVCREAKCDETKGHSQKKLLGWHIKQELSRLNR